MKKFVFFMFLLIPGLLILQTSCDKSKNDSDTTQTPTVGKEIWPLKVGNRWKYNFLNNTYAFFELTVVGSITIQVNGSSIVVYEIQATDWDSVYGIDSIPRYYKNQPDGLYYYGYPQNVLTDPVMIVKYPSNVGESWVYPVNGMNVSFTCTSQNKQFSTPAGTFSCYEYSQVIRNTKSTPVFIHPIFPIRHPVSQYLSYTVCDYYSPGIGRVGAAYYWGTQFDPYLVLSEYHLSP